VREKAIDRPHRRESLVGKMHLFGNDARASKMRSQLLHRLDQSIAAPAGVVTRQNELFVQSGHAPPPGVAPLPYRLVGAYDRTAGASRMPVADESLLYTALTFELRTHGTIHRTVEIPESDAQLERGGAKRSGGPLASSHQLHRRERGQQRRHIVEQIRK